MDISQHSLIYPVVHDFLSERSTSFYKIGHDEHSLWDTGARRHVSQYFYDLYRDERGNIFLGVSGTFKTYSFLLDFAGKTYNINYVLHEYVGRFIDLPASTDLGFFKLMDSKPAYQYGGERCDAGRNGPVVFLRDGQIPIGTIVNTTRPFSLSDLESHYSVLSVDGIGHLVYVKYREGQNDSNEYFETNESDLPTASRTIAPTIKLIFEWSTVAGEPWNCQDAVALAAKDFINCIDMPENVKNEINVGQPDMQVVKYLRGFSDARKQPDTEEIGTIGKLTKMWLKSKMFYPNTTVMYRCMFS